MRRHELESGALAFGKSRSATFAAVDIVGVRAGAFCIGSSTFPRLLFARVIVALAVLDHINVLDRPIE